MIFNIIIWILMIISIINTIICERQNKSSFEINCLILFMQIIMTIYHIFYIIS